TWYRHALSWTQWKDRQASLGWTQQETECQCLLLHLFDQGVVLGADVRDERGPLLLIRLTAKGAAQCLAAPAYEHLDVVREGTSETWRQCHGTWFIRLLEVVDVAPILSRRTPFRYALDGSRHSNPAPCPWLAGHEEVVAAIRHLQGKLNGLLRAVLT